MTTKVLMISAMVGSALLSACATTPSPPVEIGKNTYYLSKPNAPFSVVDAGTVAQALMQQASTFCAAKGLQLQLIENTITPTVVGRSLGGAAIQFQCVEHPGPVHLRPDNGVLTISPK